MSEATLIGIQFGDVAIMKGFVTQKQVDVCLEIQADYTSKGVPKRLGDIMIERGYLLPHQIAAIQKEQKLTQTKTIKNYEMLEKLGEGGMGTVVKGRRVSDGTTVAIKILFERLARDPQFIQRFYREANICLRLDHPNLVKGLEVGETGGLHYMVLEYVDGEDLGAALQKRMFFLEAQALAIILAAARGMDFAHKLGLIHRDVKPANLMLTRAGIVKVMDFGLARKAAGEDEDHLTVTGAVLGTPHYIAPEQVEGKVELDARSDMYSLGTTLFHMLSGRPPFIGRNLFDIFNAHLTQTMPDPRQFNKAISAETAELVMWMCQRDREKRPANMETLIVELGRLMGMPSAKEKFKNVRHEGPLTLITPSQSILADRDEILASLRDKLRCPRCNANYSGDPMLVARDQKLTCGSCSLVYPCPTNPPALRAILPDEIELEDVVDDTPAPNVVHLMAARPAVQVVKAAPTHPPSQPVAPVDPWYGRLEFLVPWAKFLATAGAIAYGSYLVYHWLDKLISKK